MVFCRVFFYTLKQAKEIRKRVSRALLSEYFFKTPRIS
jgi:hypothetical protein